ncbi:MAG TPA: DUF4013 domain-containing protein [Herpetosiphonaceae bacterium]
MDLKRGLSYPTLDPEWVVKVLIGTLISIIPILNFVAIGYTMDTTRNVYHGRDTPLPEWNDFGGQFIRGFLGTVLQFLWGLPLLLLACPLIFILVGSIDPSTGEPTAASGAVIACLPIAIILGVLVLSPFMMAAFTRYAVTDRFSEAMPGPVLREVSSAPRPWLLILAAAFGFVVFAIVFQLCTLGFGALLFIPLTFYMQLVAAHWYAQAHRVASGGSAAPPSMV